MGCGGRHFEPRPEQKWDYISLKDFKSTSCLTPFAYGYLWFSLFLSVAVYAVDTFTAVNLLAFGKWSSTVLPTTLVSPDITKWIFSICIILSFVNLGYEHIRARRVMNRGSVAESYLDNLAVRLESVRFGKGLGWKRFLVFAELTKNKKGAEYIALFTYFGLQSWVRVILCSGPRQFINGLTLYSIYSSKLSIEGTTFENSLMSFFAKIRLLAVDEPQQALVISGMIFTMIVWIFSFLTFVLSILFFIFFLWHYVPKGEGGLSGYCERKANKRLMKIVSIKINKAMFEDERRRKKAELKAAKKSGTERPMSMRATLPDVGDDKLPMMPGIGRTDTMTTMSTLPAYSSQATTPGSFELGSLDQKRPYPSRTATQSTSASALSARQPLIGGAADFGYDRSGSPAPSLPAMDLNNYPPVRPSTAASNRSYATEPALGRMNTNGSGYTAGYTASPSTYSADTMPSMPPRVPTAASFRSSPGPSLMSNRPPYGDDHSSERSSPAPSIHSFRGNPLSPRGVAPPGYPNRSATNPIPARGPPAGPPYPPSRNMTAPAQRHQPGGSNDSVRSLRTHQQPPYPHSSSGSGDFDYFGRPGTSNSQRSMPRQGNGNGNGNGWNQDPERGQGPRY